MKHIKFVAKFALLALVAVAAGCAGDPVNPRMSLNNAASPQASEAVFVMPPNPFQDEPAGPAVDTDDRPGMDHSPHDRAVHRSMDHPGSPGDRTSSPAGSQDQTEMHLHREHTR